jgi:hypothetical protein
MRSPSSRRWARTWLVYVLVVGSLGALAGTRAHAQTGPPPPENVPPFVAVMANGERLGVPELRPIGPILQPLFRTGQPLQLEALALDADGLGFTVFAFAGVSTPISYLWDFGGGTANPFAIFAQRPVVTFDLAPGEESRTFTLTLTVFDTTGLSTTSKGSITIDRSGPPVLNLIVGDFVVPTLGGLAGPLTVFQTDPVVRFGSLAFDESGLGFPIFAPFGSTARVSHVWSFGVGQPASALDVFSPSPTVTFPVQPGQANRFPVSLTVFDATGQSTTRSVIVSFVGSLPGRTPAP